MASYFGEVIHPTSRAFWNDDEDDEAIDSVQENAKFVVEWLEPEPSHFENFLIVEGEIVIEFITTYLLKNAKCIGTISCKNDKTCTKIYVLDNCSVYICTIDTKLDLVQTGLLTETIAPVISKSKNLFTLTSDHISRFKSEEINSTSFLKCLYSNKANEKNNFKVSKLNQPNIVTGVCAGVLSYAEIANLNCIMYILYTDTFVLDSENAFPLIELFSYLLGKTLPNFVNGSSSFFNKGNLYM